MTPRSMDKTASRSTCSCAEIAGENPDCAIHGIAAVISDLRQRSDGVSQSSADWLEQYADDRRQSLRSLSDSVSDGSKGVRVKPEGADYRAIHDAAVAAYEAATPADYRYSAIALRKAVDAGLAVFSALALDSGTGGQQPVAWHHRLIHTKGYDFDSEVTESEEHPFGRPGRDYDASFSVVSSPLYLAPTEPKAGVGQ